MGESERVREAAERLGAEPLDDGWRVVVSYGQLSDVTPGIGFWAMCLAWFFGVFAFANGPTPVLPEQLLVLGAFPALGMLALWMVNLARLMWSARDSGGTLHVLPTSIRVDRGEQVSVSTPSVESIRVQPVQGSTDAALWVRADGEDVLLLRAAREAVEDVRQLVEFAVDRSAERAGAEDDVPEALHRLAARRAEEPVGR